MPYIDKRERADLDFNIGALIDTIRLMPDSMKDGAVNYAISRIASESLREPDRWKYTTIARIVAAFECAKMEFYRRVAGPKEDAALWDNGDLPAYFGKRQ